MKKIFPYVSIAVIILFIIILFLSLGKVQHMVVIKEGNLKQIPLEITLGKYQDSDCGMIIEDLTYASQIVAPDGKTWFFHDHGGFVQWLQDKSFEKIAKIWVMSRDTNEWIDAKEAFYSVNELTPMGYGFGAYVRAQEGFIDFDTMRLRVLRGETLNNPKLRKEILGESWKR